MSTKTWFYHGRHKKVSQKYFIMVSSSLMVQLSSTFHWTNQHVHHSVKCCVTGTFIHSTPCCGYCSWLSWLVMVKTNLYQYLSDSSFSYTNCCFKIRDIKVQTRCNEIQAAPERHRYTDVVPNTDFHKNQTHIISYEVALTELKKNDFLWKAHEKPVLVNANYVTFYKPHWITACHIDNKGPAAGLCKYLFCTIHKTLKHKAQFAALWVISTCAAEQVFTFRSFGCWNI